MHYLKNIFKNKSAEHWKCVEPQAGTSGGGKLCPTSHRKGREASGLSCAFGESTEGGVRPASRRLFPGFEKHDSRLAPLLEFFFF